MPTQPKKRKLNAAGKVIFTPKQLKKRRAGRKVKEKAKKEQDAIAGEDKRAEAAIQNLVDSMANEQFGGAESVLNDELRRGQAHSSTIDRAYADYQQQVAGLAGQQQQAMAQAASAQQGVAQGVAGMTAGLGQEQAARSQQQAQQYGLGGGALARQAVQMGGDLANVGGLRAQAQAGSTAAVGLAQSGQIAETGRVAARSRIEDKQKNQQAIGLLGTRKVDLAKQKGASKVKTRQDIRQQAQELQLARETLGQKASDSARDAELELLGLKLRGNELKAITDDREADNARADDALGGTESDRAADNARDDERLSETQRANRARERNNASKKATEKGVPKLSPAKRSEWRQKKSKVLSLTRRFRSMKGSGRYKNTAEITVDLRKKGFTDTEINMARDLALRSKNNLSVANRRAAEGYFPGGFVPGGFIAGNNE